MRSELSTYDRPSRPTLSILLHVATISGKCCRAEGASAEGTLSARGISTSEDLLPAPHPIQYLRKVMNTAAKTSGRRIPQLATMNIDPIFIELTADAFRTI